MRQHPRVRIVNKASWEINEAFFDLCPAGSVIESACMDVCRVEILCLRASEHGIVPPEPWQARSKKLWSVVRAKVEEHGLTWGEAARIVHHLSDSWLSLIVRIERHGDREDARADLAYDEGDNG